MADECTDVTTIEELAITESIYSALVEYCWEKDIQFGRLIWDLMELLLSL